MELKKAGYIALAIIVIDQLTKYIFRNMLRMGREIEIMGDFFKLKLTYNTGAAFSILSGKNLFLIFITIAIAGVLVYYIIRTEEERLPIAIVLGGAIGNLLDRIFFSSVVDFIDIWRWPVFNIADVAITCGVIYLILNVIKKKK